MDTLKVIDINILSSFYIFIYMFSHPHDCGVDEGAAKIGIQ